MYKLLIYSSFLIFSVCSIYPQSIIERYSKYGDVILCQLKSAPFPHSKRSGGHSYNKEYFSADKHYQDSSVLIFIPKEFKQSSETDMVVHFHGWRNNIDSLLSQFDLIEQFVQSEKNAILIIPQGPKNSPDSFGGKLEDKLGFKNFIIEIIDFLFKSKKISSKKTGNLILSGHSGGYHAISYILNRGGLSSNIKEVFLFDALYGQTEKFVYWIDHNKGKLINIFTDSGGTKNETQNLLDALDGWEFNYFISRDTDCTLDDLKNNKLIFLTTDLSHNDVIRYQNFSKFLKGSSLSNLK